MKFEVKIEEFWLDDDSDQLEPELKNYIQREVIQHIWKKIEEKVTNQIELQVQKMIEKVMYRKTQGMINKIIKDPEFKITKYGGYSSDSLVTIPEYIKLKFSKDSGWSKDTNADVKIKRIADNFAIELRNRYDLMFASQIVIKMNENGLLKEGVDRILLENNK